MHETRDSANLIFEIYFTDLLLFIVPTCIEIYRTFSLAPEL
jgi:hypothetical protein